MADMSQIGSAPQYDNTDLEAISGQMRADILKIICKAGSGHPGGSLSCIDILSTLYLGGVMNYDPQNPNMDGRDRFVMAKGHAAPALYVTLAYAGFFPKEILLTLRELGSTLQGHPDSNLVPGVEVSTGSLGQGLSIAAGIACGLRIAGDDACVFSLLGDGECEEGQVWEAAMFASHQNLGHLIAIIDQNDLQIDGCTQDVAGLGDLKAKFESFGWDVTEMDGHDFEDIKDKLMTAKSKASSSDEPQAIIAKTVKGKGVSFMENECGWHGKAPSEEQLSQALSELSCKEGMEND